MIQVKTLQDILKIIPWFTLSKTSNNLTSISKPTLPNIDLTALRLYINDHDMSSSSFGSAFMVWGEMPIEYIDHIEVYKGSSSVEFGNEVASTIIKLYTKKAQREEGSKLRFYMDNKLSSNIDLYVASSIDDFSYFAYGNTYNTNKKTYTKTYNNKSYDLNSDLHGHNIYANFTYKNFSMELGSYAKTSDGFLGAGVIKTPSGGDLDSFQNYIHITQKFDNNIKLQFSYDNLSYQRTYIDTNGIKIANLPQIDNYLIKFNDEILNAVAEKRFNYHKHSFLFGTFFKQKRFKEHGVFSNTILNNLDENSFSNTLDLTSAYLEYKYDYDNSTRFMISLKDDYFHYKKDIASTNEIIAKLALIKNINKFQIKTFLTKSYIPTSFFKLYNPQNIPYKANPYLKTSQLYIGSFSIRYKTKQHYIELLVAKNKIIDTISYDASSYYGWFNSSNDTKYTRYAFKYKYTYNTKNKISMDFFMGDNNKGIEVSPKYNVNIQMFNRYKKLDIYNEFIYRSSYSSADIYIDASINYTLSLKYHLKKDLSLGLRGENLLNYGYEQAYKGYDSSIPVTDRKVWFNMEYLF
jgi:iron complex outermembrane receptor protein